jgi:hypothetical protein
MTDTHPADIREAVRERYASAAREAARGAYDEARRIDAGADSCGTGGDPATDDDVFGVTLYGEEARGVPRAARRRSAPASPPRWRTCWKARPCSTWARAPAPTR